MVLVQNLGERKCEWIPSKAGKITMEVIESDMYFSVGGGIEKILKCVRMEPRLAGSRLPTANIPILARPAAKFMWNGARKNLLLLQYFIGS